MSRILKSLLLLDNNFDHSLTIEIKEAFKKFVRRLNFNIVWIQGYLRKVIQFESRDDLCSSHDRCCYVSVSLSVSSWTVIVPSRAWYPSICASGNALAIAFTTLLALAEPISIP